MPLAEAQKKIFALVNLKTAKQIGLMIPPSGLRERTR
jgi:hypothetical protein